MLSASTTYACPTPGFKPPSALPLIQGSRSTRIPSVCMPYGALLPSMQHDAGITYTDPTPGFTPTSIHILSRQSNEQDVRSRDTTQCMKVIWYPLIMLTIQEFTSVKTNFSHHAPSQYAQCKDSIFLFLKKSERTDV